MQPRHRRRGADRLSLRSCEKDTTSSSATTATASTTRRTSRACSKSSATDEADIVVGSRFLAREGYQSTFVRRIGILILGVVSALVGSRVTDPTSGYWAVNRRALKVLVKYQPDDYPETEALVLAARAGCRVKRAARHHVRAHRRPVLDRRLLLGFLHDEGRAGAPHRAACDQDER